MRPSVLYLSAQSALVALWWLVMASRPDVRDWFRPAGWPDETLLAFWLTDLLCIAVGSALAAVLVHRHDRRRIPALWFTTGALMYATLYCIGVSSLTGESWIATGLMAPAAAITLFIARAES